MTGYSLAHLALAFIGVSMALLHAVLWRVGERDPVQAYVAIVFLAWALVGWVVGTGSVASLDPTTPARVGLASIGLFAVWAGMIGITTASGGLPARWARRLAFAAAAVALTFGVEAVIAVHRLAATGAMHRWETLWHIESAWSAPAVWILTSLVYGLWLLGALASVRGRPVYWFLVGSVLPYAGLLGWDLRLVLGLGEGAAAIAFSGVALTLLAGIHAASRFLASQQMRLEGSYEILQPLGAGGMGELFLASRRGPAGFERRVALKRMLPRSAGWRSTARFLQEARLAASLHHRNIVGVHDLGFHADGWFIVMEHLAGVSLRELRDASHEDDPIPVGVVLAVGEQVCAGLAYAHDRGVVHRDVSSHNVMVTRDGEVKLIDFGLAQPMEPLPEGRPEVTEPGRIAGNPGYLPPEVLLGQAAQARSDLYCLGVVLYELLVGRRPHHDLSPAARLEAQMSEELPAEHREREDVPGALADLIDRAISVRPEDRFLNAREMGEALRGAGRPFTVRELAGWVSDRIPERPVPPDDEATATDSTRETATDTEPPSTDPDRTETQGTRVDRL